jgi:hypothetical protein
MTVHRTLLGGTCADGSGPRGRCRRDRSPLGLGCRVPGRSPTGARHSVGRRFVRRAGHVAVGNRRWSVYGVVRHPWFPDQRGYTQPGRRRWQHLLRHSQPNRPRHPRYHHRYLDPGTDRCAHRPDRGRDRDGEQLPEAGAPSVCTTLPPATRSPGSASSKPGTTPITSSTRTSRSHLRCTTNRTKRRRPQASASRDDRGAQRRIINRLLIPL